MSVLYGNQAQMKETMGQLEKGIRNCTKSIEHSTRSSTQSPTGSSSILHSRTEDPVDDLPDNEEDDDFVLDEQGDPFLQEFPLETENTANGLALLWAPGPFYLSTGNTRRVCDVPICSSWYREHCPPIQQTGPPPPQIPEKEWSFPVIPRYQVLPVRGT